MARVSLDTVWINAKGPDGYWSDAIQLVSASGLEQTETGNIRVRNATGDRVVVTVLPGDSATWRLDCQFALPYEVAWLRKHRKQLLAFRDMHGERIFGAYSDVTRTPHFNGTHFQVSLTVTQGEAS